MIRSMLAVAAISAVSGCTHAAPPSAAQYDDLAHQLGAITVFGGAGGVVGATADALALARGEPLADFTSGPPDHSAGTHAGVAYDYTLACRDISGAVAPCGATTDTAEVAATSSAIVPRGELQRADLDSHWQLRGVAGSDAVADGEGSVTYGWASVDGGAYAVTATATYAALTLDARTAAATSGEIRYDLAAVTIDGVDASFEVSADVTFTAFGSATLVIDGARDYALDCATGDVVRAP